MKFLKPFASWKPILKGSMSLKENWKLALRDPGFLFMWGLIIVWYILIFAG